MSDARRWGGTWRAMAVNILRSRPMASKRADLLKYSSVALKATIRVFFVVSWWEYGESRTWTLKQLELVLSL